MHLFNAYILFRIYPLKKHNVHNIFLNYLLSIPFADNEEPISQFCSLIKDVTKWTAHGFFCAITVTIFKWLCLNWSVAAISDLVQR